MPNAARPATVDIRARVLTALRAAHGRELTTSEICVRAGFTNFEHHAYVSPQLRALAKLGVIIRSPFVVLTPHGVSTPQTNPMTRSTRTSIAPSQPPVSSRADGASRRDGYLTAATSSVATHLALSAVSPSVNDGNTP
ncbi:Uncharacterised protein [Mycobacteroides abscessus subsp. abscessus]|uniref:hypothetical protein n=1 Tax=Mycobacteroides abscessus TaxID=36809 RepID=UPI0009CD2DD6|nr:hypothetical protein [Mycobacteroides abscessus]SLI01035.1 Uncharacterised protein [Mycobacteroides abscessus subsp. abscessus]